MRPLQDLRRVVVVSAALAAGCAAAQDSHPTTNWFERVLVGMEVGPTGAQFGYSDPHDTRYCARFDGRQIVRRALRGHSEYLVFWARDGDFAYYDSKLLRKAPGLGRRDPLREAVEEAGRHRLPVIAYCVAQQGGHFLKAHPEWEMRGADGKPLGRFCYNSGYLEAMKAILAEQLAYGIAGFHVDMLDQGFGPPYGCWCDICQARFEQEFGRPMPREATWDEAWDKMLEFRYRSSERFEQALAGHVKALNPAASVDFNYHGNPPFSFEVGQRPVQHAANGDFITGETGVWGFSPLAVGLNAEFYRAAAPGQRVQVAMQRGVRMYHDQTTRPLHDLRWELLTLLSHGAFVTVVDKTAFDGWLDPVAYERIGTAFEEARSKRPHFGQTPLQDVALYFSSRTRDWVGRTKPADYFTAFQGAHRAMVYEHIPWGVLLDENLSLETLRRFPVVLLPNAGILAAREVALLRSYVEKGGKLILTGLSGCYDDWGRLGTNSILGALTGAVFVRPLDSLDNWMTLPAPNFGHAAVLAAGIAHARVPAGDAAPFSRVPFLVKGPAGVFAAVTAEPLGELLSPHRTARQQEGKEGTEWPMSADAAVGPAILINRLGKGTVVTFAGSPDFATASEHHIAEARKLLANAVRFLLPKPRLRITAPAAVEAVVTQEPATATLRVHLLGYNAPPQTTPPKDRPYALPATLEDEPVFRVIIELDRPPKQATALNKSTVLRRKGARIEATVAGIHEVLQVR